MYVTSSWYEPIVHRHVHTSSRNTPSYLSDMSHNFISVCSVSLVAQSELMQI